MLFMCAACRLGLIIAVKAAAHEAIDTIIALGGRP